MAVTKTEQAHNILEHMIVFNELDPTVMYSEKQLTRLTGLGRTPIREALMRFAHDNMAVIHPRRGVRFPAVTLENALHLLEVRRGLEPLCVSIAASRATSTQRKTLSKLSKEFSSLTSNSSDTKQLKVLREAQNAIQAATGNHCFFIALNPLHGPSRRFWYAHRSQEDNYAAAAIYARMLQNIADGDSNAAVESVNSLLDFLTAFTMRSVRNISYSVVEEQKIPA